MSEPGSFGSLDSAIAMRDYLDQLVVNVVDRIRPAPKTGTVLTITKSGATFNTGNTSDPEGPHPVLPGNPDQLFYAQVLLDTGEIVPARVADNIPVARQASIYDPS